jgi:hypothetical protein
MRELTADPRLPVAPVMMIDLFIAKNGLEEANISMVKIKEQDILQKKALTYFGKSLTNKDEM